MNIEKDKDLDPELDAAFRKTYPGRRPLSAKIMAESTGEQIVRVFHQDESGRTLLPCPYTMIRWRPKEKELVPLSREDAEKFRIPHNK